MKQLFTKIKKSLFSVPSFLGMFCFLMLLSFPAKAQDCKADFVFDSGQKPGEIIFTDISSGIVNDWYWLFGDGDYSTSTNPVHTYSKSGDYKVSLVISDRKSCNDTIEYIVPVETGNQGCSIIANFGYNINPQAEQTAIFSDKSIFTEGSIDSYYWDFGDDSPVSKKQNPEHTFTKEGEYYVTLTVEDFDIPGCTDSKAQVIKIGKGTQCSLSPHFITTPDVKDEQTIKFKNNSSIEAVKFRWDFGDDQYSSERDPVHTYRKPGGYYVLLTVSNSDGSCTEDFYSYLEVGTGGCKVNPSFSAEVTGKQVVFYNYSAGPVTNYYWDFGDGYYSKEKEPKHTYKKDGGYFVNLTVEDNTTLGCQNVYSDYVEVGTGGCKTSAYFKFLVDSNIVLFSDESYGKVTNYFWNFGDGSYSSEKTPKHKYKKNGGYYVTLTVIDSLTDGCQNSYSEYLAIGDGGCRTTAYYTAIPDSGSPTVKFTDKSFGTVTDYYWDFGTGDYSKEMHPKYAFPKPGGYYVSLTVSDANVAGCQNTYWTYIQAGEGGCTAGAHFNALPSTEDNLVRFTDKSYGKINAWYWDFGNGDYSKDQNVKYEYKESGGYYVGLTVSDTTIKGCQNTYWEYISVGKGGCTSYPNFSYRADSNTVYFSDNSYGSVTNWHWDFGNGDVSEKQNPKYTFKRNGYYTVCLTISDSASRCQNYFCDYVKIGAEESCQAKFVAMPRTTSNVVLFTDKSVSTSDSWYWDFGDGNYSTDQSPKYEYKNSGYYYVCLYTYNSKTGCGSSYCDFTKVGSQADCQAKFSAMPYDLTVVFSDESLGAPTGWAWNFGNGDYSYDKNPKYAYKKPGYYTVTLSITNKTTNCISEYRSTIQVGQAECKASFKYFIDPATKKASFSNTSLGKASELYWDFGDGSYSTDTDPSHTYARQGYYWVCLYTYDKSSGCMDSYREQIRAGNGKCAARFSSSSKENSKTILFNDESKGSATEWSWDFGDGSTSSTQNPDHEYKRGGYYSVCLTTFDKASGCMDSYCNSIHVNGSDCKASYNFYTDPLTNKVVFKDESYGNPSTYYWNFGDGSYSTDHSPEHSYAYEGIYTTCVYTYDTTSFCSDYFCQDIKAGSGGSDCETKFETFTKGKELTAQDISTGKPDYWFYDFGDGDYSIDQNPNHTYSRDGYYSVCLTTYSSTSGCVSTNCNNVTIGFASATDCNAKFSFVTNPDTRAVKFKDESFGDPISWKWKFDSSGTSSNLSSPKHKYAADGVYTVYLTIETASGCKKSYADVVAIGKEGLYADFIYKNDSAYVFKNQVTYPVSFYGSAYGKPSKWKWAFGDNTYDSLRVNPTHYYQAAGAYNACLTISDPVAKLSSIKCNQVKVGGEVTGIQNEKTSVALNVYPNPMTGVGVISYNLTRSSSVKLNLIDMNGRLIQTISNGNQNSGSYQQAIDIASFNVADGMYLINLLINNKAYNIPLVIKK